MAIVRDIATTLGGLGNGLMDWLQPKVVDIGGLGDFIFFRAVFRFLSSRIEDFGFDVMGRVMGFVGFLALIVLTLWIFFQGYKVITGQMRESLMGLVANMAKAAFIVSCAVAFGTVGSEIHTYLTQDMKDGINELVTGNSGSPEEKIDESLGWLQVAMSTFDALDLQGDPALVAEKERVQFYVTMGTGGPAVVAGAMLLLYQIAMALFIGLGPIFILCLLFDFTKGLFQKWLFYGIGTMFSMAMLSFVVSLALDMVTRVAIAMWTSAAAGQFLLGVNVNEGMSSQAMQQGGMGLILTALIVSAPPMAALFFNGVMGSFLHFSAFGAGGMIGPQGQPPGSFGGGSGYNPQAYQPTQPVSNAGGGDGRSVNRPTGAGDFPTQTPTYSTGPGGTAGNPSQVQSGLGPGARGAVNTQQQGAPAYTPTSPSETESGGSQANYSPENPGARGAANTTPTGSPQPQYAPPPSGSGPAASVPQGAPPASTTPAGAPPYSASPQGALPVGTPTRVADSPHTQPQAPTYTPPPTPRDPVPRGGS